MLDMAQLIEDFRRRLAAMSDEELRAADNLDMSFGNTFIEFYQDKVLITWQGTEHITYNLEQFAAMTDNWKKQVKENEE